MSVWIINLLYAAAIGVFLTFLFFAINSDVLKEIKGISGKAGGRLVLLFCLFQIAVVFAATTIAANKASQQDAQVAFEQGAEKAVGYLQDNVSSKYDWEEITFESYLDSIEDADELYEFIGRVDDNTRSMYKALEDVMSYDGVDIAQHIELDR